MVKNNDKNGKSFFNSLINVNEYFFNMLYSVIDCSKDWFL